MNPLGTSLVVFPASALATWKPSGSQTLKLATQVYIQDEYE